LSPALENIKVETELMAGLYIYILFLKIGGGFFLLNINFRRLSKTKKKQSRRIYNYRSTHNDKHSVPFIVSLNTIVLKHKKPAFNETSRDSCRIHPRTGYEDPEVE
jgi:hypothetical protein